MGFIKKIWKDRISEFPNRRTLTKVAGSVDGNLVVDVARNEGLISQVGDAYNSANMNDLEQRIADAIGTGDIPEELGGDIISAINSLNTDIHQLDYDNATTLSIDSGNICTIPADGILSISVRCANNTYGYIDFNSNKRSGSIISITTPSVPTGIYSYVRQEVYVSKGEKLAIFHLLNIEKITINFIPYKLN